MAAAQHAFAHIVLEGQRAHGELFYIVLHGVLGQFLDGLDLRGLALHLAFHFSCLLFLGSLAGQHMV